MVTTSLQVNIPGQDDNQNVSLNQAMDNTFPYRENIRNVSSPQNTVTTGSDVEVRPSNAQTGTSVADSQRQQLQTAEDTLRQMQDTLAQRQGSQGEPTVGESLDGIGTGLDSGPTYEEVYGEEDESSEERAIRNQMKLFQQEIDATNQVYDQMLNEARLEGQGRLGSQRAIGARGGILGSDFAGAQKSRVQDFNQEERDAVQAERLAAIGAIRGKISDAMLNQRREKRIARQQGAENYLAWLANRDQRDQQNAEIIASDLVNAGIDPATLSEQELATITQEAGIGPEAVLRSYRQLQAEQEQAQFEQEGELLERQKTRADIDKINADIEEGKIREIGEGTMLYDTRTGETFKNPKTYKPDSPSGLSVGGRTLNQEAIADVHAELQSNRGEDGYTNTDTYLREFDGFVRLGGDPKDFIEEYDPDVYINPGDPTRSFLQQFMRRTPTEDVNTKANETAQLISQLETMRSSE